MQLPWLTKRVTVSHHAQLRPAGRFTALVRASIGPAGEAVGVWTDPDTRQRMNDTGTAHVVISGAVTITTAGSTRVVHFAGYRGFRPVGQPMPDGCVLLVGEHWDGEPFESGPNAAILGSDGRLQQIGDVGDGIEHVRTTRDGDIWIGYNDMGVYAHRDSAGPGFTPIGAPGLLRFAPDLKIAWEYPGDEPVGTVPEIDDCEALTLTDNAVWVYPYTEYPVVQIAGDQPRAWWPAKAADASPRGVQTLVVGDDLVGIVGGYSRREAGRVHLVDLGAEQWTSRRRVQLVLPDQNRNDDQVTVSGHNDQLHVFQGDHWYVTDISALIA